MRTRSLRSLLLASLALCICLGCTTVLRETGRYQFFAQPDSADAWSAKITAWQHREELDNGVTPGTPGTVGAEPQLMPSESHHASALVHELASVDADGSIDGLRAKYFRFRADRRRGMAAEFVDWIQLQARDHYVSDGAIDHWATFEETLRENGDDCDGLELLVYHGLRDLGFSEREVYRAIVYRPSDGQHHMVTLWFEDPTDPWVLDPTGAMTSSMLLMSELPAWVPLKLFSETAEYTVRRKSTPTARLASTELHR